MFIHELDNWTNFNYDAQKLLDVVAEVNMAVGDFNGRLKSIGFDEQMTASVETATSNIVASSEVEGVVVNTDEVRSSVARKLGVPLQEETTPSHYVEGIVDMFLDAVVNYDKPLTEQRLFSWHQLLFPVRNLSVSDMHIGQYRNSEMSVVSGTFGRERIHYRAPGPERVGPEMADFLKWLNDDSVRPSFIKSAIAHLWFVSIHPFADGNGRIARAISDMIFAQIEKSGKRFFSMSKQINKDKKHYYKVLERVQRGDGDITEWLMWYLNCIKEAVVDASEMLNLVLRKTVFWRNHADVSVSDRQRNILNLYLDGYDAKITIKNWMKLAEVSKDTALRDITDLVNKGILLPAQGRVRNVSYSIVYKEVSPVSCFENIQIENGVISVVYEGKSHTDHLLSSDVDRLCAEEISKEDLAYKYFAYLLPEEK